MQHVTLYINIQEKNMIKMSFENLLKMGDLYIFSTNAYQIPIWFANQIMSTIQVEKEVVEHAHKLLA